MGCKNGSFTSFISNGIVNVFACVPWPNPYEHVGADGQSDRLNDADITALKSPFDTSL